VQYIHAVTPDGKFHSLYVSNGEEPNPPLQFLPSKANASGLMVYDNVAYVATVNGCGNVEKGIWALDLESKKVSQWKTARELSGSTGFAAGPDGVLYAAAGADLVALEPGTLSVKSSYQAGTEFTSSPIVFEYHGKDIVAVAAKEGQVHLFDSAAIKSQPLAKSPSISKDLILRTLSSFQDSAGRRWILASALGSLTSVSKSWQSHGDVANGAIVAFEVADENGSISVQPRWISRDMIAPLAPAIVNGVIFALSSGDFHSTEKRVSLKQRLKQSTPAVLYALDGATGNESWNSGSAITSFVHSGGLAVSGSQIYVGSHDGTQYAFGFPVEH
jgi:outer membrane protein assembly factor BamB